MRELGDDCQSYWDIRSTSTCRCLDYSIDEIKRYIYSDAKDYAEKYGHMFPINLFYDLEGKKVLLLGCGGGEQSIFLSLLGASCTVIDISSKQLEKDSLAGEKYQYPIRTICRDMTEDFPDFLEKYHMIYIEGINYVKNVVPLISNTYSLLEKDGVLRIGFRNPILEFSKYWIEEDKLFFGIEDYSVKEKIVNNKSGKIVVYRHTYKELFDALVGHGYRVTQIDECPCYPQGVLDFGSVDNINRHVPNFMSYTAKII